MDALIFDFDGVVVDSEPVHFACFHQVLASVGVDLRKEDYYSKYLGYDDRDCFAHVLADNGKPADEKLIAKLTARKTQCVQHAFHHSIQPLPGVLDLLQQATAAGVPKAICSGALRAEIELAAQTVGALEHFQAIVSAEEVAHGKPDPEGYRLSLSRLSSVLGRSLRAERCLVIEDAPAGILAAHGAGMKVLAVATSYPPAELAQAERIVPSLESVTLDVLRKIC